MPRSHVAALAGADSSARAAARWHTGEILTLGGNNFEAPRKFHAARSRRHRFDRKRDGRGKSTKFMISDQRLNAPNILILLALQLEHCCWGNVRGSERARNRPFQY